MRRGPELFELADEDEAEVEDERDWGRGGGARGSTG
jgi:hypothetical protein